MENTYTVKVRKPFGKRWGWMNHIDVVTNLPVTKAKKHALRLDAKTASDICYNLNHRGWCAIAVEMTDGIPKNTTTAAWGASQEKPRISGFFGKFNNRHED